jgi:hypothetical protein
MRLERKANHYIVFDTKKDGKEARIGRIAAADYEIKGKLLDLPDEKRRELDKLIAEQKLRNWSVVEKAHLVIYGMQTADAAAMVQNVLDGDKPLPAIEKEDLDGLIEQLTELREGLAEVKGRLKEQLAK